MIIYRCARGKLRDSRITLRLMRILLDAEKRQDG